MAGFPSCRTPDGLRDGHFFHFGEVNDVGGLSLFLRIGRLRGAYLRPDPGPGSPGSSIMSGLMLLSGLVALSLFVYLLAALFFPEKF